MFAADFICVSRDIGGARTLLQVADELRWLGKDVFFLPQADSPAEEVLRGADEPFRSVRSVEHFFHLTSELDSYTVLLSWCADVGREVLPFLNERGTPTVLVEDSWWHGGVLDSLTVGSRSRLVCVGTEHDRTRVLDAWEDYPPERVQVTGWPSFDEYAGYDVARVAKRVQATLELNGSWPLAFLSVDNSPGIGELCRDVVGALNEIGLFVYLVPAWHPGFDRTVPKERPAVEAALAQFEVGKLVDRRNVPTSELVTAADIVVATYSSLLAVAAALRKEVIAVLYPETGYAQMQAEMGVPEFPLVELGCGAKAGNANELREILERAVEQELGLEAAQGHHFRLDGQNANRVAEASLKFF